MKHAARHGLRAFASGIALMSAVVGVLAQPDDRARGAPPHRGGAGEHADGSPQRLVDRDRLRDLADLPPAERRARFREFLENRLRRLDRARESIRQSLEALDNGEPLDRILQNAPPDLRPGPRGGGPPGMPDGSGEPGGDLNELGPVLPGDGIGLGEGPPPSRGGPGHPRGVPGRDAPREITDADRQAFEKFLSAASPVGRERITALRQKDPERADRLLMEAMPRIGWLLEISRRDPELFELRLRDIRLGREALEASRALAAFDREHPGADGPRREALVAKVRSALENQYQVRGQLMEHEIARLDRDLSRRRAELSERASGREAAIDRALERLRERAREWSRHAKDRPGDRRPHRPDDDADLPPDRD